MAGDGEPFGNSLSGLCEEFRRAMLAKLLRQQARGYTGWQDAGYKAGMQKALLEHVARAIVDDDPKQWIDVGNLAAFLWSLEGRPS